MRWSRIDRARPSVPRCWHRLDGHQAANDEVARSGAFVASLLRWPPGDSHELRLAVNLSDALINRYTGCPS